MRLIHVLEHPARPASAPLRRLVQEGGAEDLAQRAVAGDRGAFSVLMAAHKQELYRFVRRRVSDPDDAYDIVQETFVSAWLAISRFDVNRSFGAWLRAIALNKSRDHARRAAVRRALKGAMPASGADARAIEPSPEEELIARDGLAALKRALALLPTHLRDALMLTAVDGMSHAAASAVLGCSVKAVEYRVSRARQVLARHRPDACG